MMTSINDSKPSQLFSDHQTRANIKKVYFGKIDSEKTLEDEPLITITEDPLPKKPSLGWIQKLAILGVAVFGVLGSGAAVVINQRNQEQAQVLESPVTSPPPLYCQITSPAENVPLPAWNASADVQSFNFIDLQSIMSDYGGSSGCYDYQTLARAAANTEDLVYKTALSRLSLLARSYDRTINQADIEQLARHAGGDIVIQFNELLELPTMLNWTPFPVREGGAVSFIKLQRILLQLFEGNANVFQGTADSSFNHEELRAAATFMSNSYANYTDAKFYSEALIRLADWSQWTGEEVTMPLLERMTNTVGDGLFINPSTIIRFQPSANRR